MTSQVVRLYAFAASLLVFFLAWAGIAAHPWKHTPTPQTRSALTLDAYRQRLQADSALLRQLSAKSPLSAGTPSVRVVTLPPLTTTRTS
jgi:hypothetical protein